ncbi:ATP-binding protein [Neptunomonas sp.]|uniref:ATP-binding protein n=1 Tax=Neptunomonas sp. TaxID=1971898 RepID=UPI003566813C
MRSRIFIKLLLTLLATLAVTVVLMLVVVNWSFQRGFVAYIQQGETEQVTGLADLLSEQYAKQENWNFLLNSRGRWPQILASAGIEMPPPPHGSSPQRTPQREPPGEQFRESGQPLHDQPALKPVERSSTDWPAASAPLAHRISVIDVNRKPLLGPKTLPDNTQWIPVQVEETTVGWLGLQPIDMVTDQLARSFINQQRYSFVWVAVSVLLLSVLVAAGWARWFLRPIHNVIQGAKQLSAGNYEARVQVKGHDELAGLALNFNQMAKTLQRNEQLRRQWVADISHELRTPIAVLSGEVEVLLDGIRKPTHQRISSLYNDIRSLSKLVDDLHQLSLADQGAMELLLTDVDIYAISHDLLLLFEPRMQEHGLKLSLDAEPSHNLSVIGDERRLIQLISNLLENSLRYTDSGGEVRIQISTTGNKLTLCVSDSTPGVPESDLSKIFDRLYRVDKSRSRSVGGSGLGLSICKTIVEAHEGQIVAKNGPLGGLNIIVQLPLSTSLKG